jgi:hypothetical protein
VSESKIKKSALSFPVTFEKVKDFEVADDRFTKVKIWLMHLGKNLNNSAFEKSVVDKAIPTLQYIPIMGFVELNDDNEKDFSDHRYVITRDEKGVRRKYMGTPYGVIKSSDDNNAHYEERLCDDGETRTFLVTEGVIWNVLEDGAEIFHRDLVKNQSMELFENSIDGYEDEDGIFHFTEFSFRAACVLGDDVTPAMTGSTVEVQFTLSDFVKNIQSELNDKYSMFTTLVNNTALVDSTSDATSIEVDKEKTNGGVEIMENTDFTQTLLGLFSDISALISQHEITVDRWGYQCPRYYAVDIQENEVIVVDTKDNYNYYGISFSVEADKPVVDFESAKRKKLRYEDYVEGETAPEGAFDFGKHIEEIENNAFAKIEDANAKVSEAEGKVTEYEAKVSEFETAKNEIEEKFNKVNAEFEDMKPKYEDFVKAEQARIEAELDAQKDAEFAKYESAMGDDADFTALKEKKSELTIKEIESECAIMYARKSLANANFSKSNDGVMTAGLIDNGDIDDGYINTKYGRMRKS